MTTCRWLSRRCVPWSYMQSACVTVCGVWSVYEHSHPPVTHNASAAGAYTDPATPRLHTMQALLVRILTQLPPGSHHVIYYVTYCRRLWRRCWCVARAGSGSHVRQRKGVSKSQHNSSHRSPLLQNGEKSGAALWFVPSALQNTSRIPAYRRLNQFVFI